MSIKVKKKSILKNTIIAVMSILACELPVSQVRAQSEADRFSEYEIRVIRPRFFQKTGRFELLGAGSLIANNTFVYTVLATGGAIYHLSETFALEGDLSAGFSLDRDEKKVIKDKFEIRTEALRVQYALDLSIQYTPIYGKIQLNNRRLIYFDTFLTGGFGMTGVEWRYSDFCTGDNAQNVPSDATKTYPSFLFGFGQRLFTSESSALRWDFKTRIFSYGAADSACSASSTDSTSSTKTFFSLQIGTSRYF